MSTREIVTNDHDQLCIVFSGKCANIWLSSYYYVVFTNGTLEWW